MLKRRLATAALVVVILLLAAPYALWRAAPARELEVVIVDHTVPDRSFREHRGLMWVLNHEKYRSSRHGGYLDARDYFGFVPGDSGRFTVRALPDPIRADLIYLADTYGVYEKEWYGTNPRGERSPLVFGGMQPDELAKVEQAARGGTPLVVEFNAFASPTRAAVRERLYDLLHVQWSGWIGRYFNDLAGAEVPTWAVAAYQRQYRQQWEFTGPGFVLADERDQVVVLLRGRDFSAGQCEIGFADSARAALRVEDGIRYRYWFDIVQLRPGARELAYFQLDLTKAGRARLQSFGVPANFPAVVRYDAGPYRAYYFAGDFVDTETVPRYFQLQGHDRLKAWLTYDRPQLENQAFFWRVYVPMLRTILREAYESPTTG
ncbi:MAG: hypothetical protein FIB01_00655 [Gemmatimonadetes bacterium]|nr:hypothetical protein [Gemmatimonadota bacterium]